MPSEREAHVQSVERAIAILKSFSPEEPELGVGELSRRLGLPKSTVFRLLQTLEAGGLISQNPETGSYRLGVDLIALAGNVLAHADVRRLSRPYLRRLADALQETVNLSILDRGDVVNLEQFVGGDRLVMRVGWVGRRMPVHAVSSGKAILAFLPLEEVQALLRPPLEALTPHTQTDPDALLNELEEVRRQGYAVALEELEEGLHAISAPVWNHERRAVASVSVSGPSYRLSVERIREIAPQVVETALEISHELGYRA